MNITHGLEIMSIAVFYSLVAGCIVGTVGIYATFLW
jgi:hypothetical protein